MNWLLTLGIILTFLGSTFTNISNIAINTHAINIITFIGGILTILGTIKQGKKDDKHQQKIEKYVNKQEKLNKPKLEVLDSQGYKIRIKNIGNETAKQVRLFIKDINGSSSIANSNDITRIGEMVKETEYLLDLNPFSGINLINDLPETEDSLAIKKEAKDLMDKFTTNKKALVITFYLEFYFENEKNTSDNYTVFIDKSGLFNIFKE